MVSLLVKKSEKKTKSSSEKSTKNTNSTPPSAPSKVLTFGKPSSSTTVKINVKKEEKVDNSTTEKISLILADSRVRQGLIALGGENAIAVLRHFTKTHSDEEIAKALKFKISDVRATLNKLHNEGLVNYLREKDSETGWYSYTWALNLERMQKWATKNGAFVLEKGRDLYFCESCGEDSIIDFESASNCDFRCERCSKLLEFLDEQKVKEMLNAEKKR